MWEWLQGQPWAIQVIINLVIVVLGLKVLFALLYLGLAVGGGLLQAWKGFRSRSEEGPE
jgi:hypothetical protein